MKKALITGIAGQDGSYLAEFLLGKEYEVHGLAEPVSGGETGNLWRIDHILSHVHLHKGSVCDIKKVYEIVKSIKPDEIYHLAAKHEVENTQQNYKEIFSTNVDSVYFLLSSLKDLKLRSKLFFASSSRVFAGGVFSPQNEKTLTHPSSLYGISKVAGSNIVKFFREKEGLFACTGILFNHESPRRDPFFVTRKISLSVAKIKAGIEKELILGDIEAKRDWGFAGDYVEAMWLILQQENPDDFVVGSGKLHSVKDFLEIAFKSVDLDWKKYVKINPSLKREKEIELLADTRKAKKMLLWEPQKGFSELVCDMVATDVEQLSKENE